MVLAQLDPIDTPALDWAAVSPLLILCGDDAECLGHGEITCDSQLPGVPRLIGQQVAGSGETVRLADGLLNEYVHRAVQQRRRAHRIGNGIHCYASHPLDELRRIHHAGRFRPA